MQINISIVLAPLIPHRASATAYAQDILAQLQCIILIIAASHPVIVRVRMHFDCKLNVHTLYI